MVGPGEQSLDSIEPTSTGDSSHLIASDSKRSQNSFGNDTEHEAKVKAIDCSTAPKTDPNLNKAAHKIGVAVDDPGTNDGEKKVEFDVVAIHGLCGQSRATWSARDPDSPEKTWLPDAFSWDSNIGRVILYGYDTDDVSIGCSTVGSVYREAVALLERLSVLREPAAKNTRRPIFFVSHDIGGLIVKAALVYASHNEAKFSDILYSTRATVFFGYPHRPLTNDDLEEQLHRLFSHRKRSYREGSMNKLIRSYAEAIISINGAFIHTNMLKQAKHVNLFSTHEDPLERIFDISTVQMGIAFEARLSDRRPHLDLTQGKNSYPSHPHIPVNDDWFGFSTKDLSNQEFVLLRQRLSQASPIYPSLAGKATLDIPELNELLKTKSSYLIHIRCSSDAQLLSENVRKQLSEGIEPAKLLYFCFDSYDNRFSNVASMLGTLSTQTIYNRPKALSELVKRLSNPGGTPQFSWTKEALFSAWTWVENLYDFDGIVHVLGCLDECDDSALWFLSRIRHTRMASEGKHKTVVITTNGSTNDHLIHDAFSKFPPTIVRTVHYNSQLHLPLTFDFEVPVLTGGDTASYTGDTHKNAVALISSLKEDEKLCSLVVRWLNSNPNSIKSIGHLVAQPGPVATESIFSAIMTQIPNNRQDWAYKMVSWILSTFRPLRPSELCSVSDLYLTEISYNRANPSSKDSNTHLSFFEILRYFGGMLVVVNDEVRFSHEAIRPWLESSKSGWYQPKPEHDRHSDILKACLAHLTYEADLRGDWVMRLPYATEYWVCHCQPKGDAATLAADFFNDEPRLQRWVDAYMALPNLFSKPMDASRIPLALAAHFGLDDILQSLLAKTQGDVEAQGQALIEAARKDQKSCLHILITSRSCNLNFNDTYVQAAMQAACSCGHDDLFKILLDAVLALTPQGHTESRQEEAFGETLREKSPKGDEEVTVGVEKQLKAAESGAKDSPNEQRPDDAPDRGDPGSSTSQEPMHWLISPLKRASYLGLADIVSKLLFLGADPNGTEEKDLGKRSALHLAVRNPNLETAKLLIDAGANLNAVTNPECFTPLHWATMGGAEVVQLLLGKGSSITAQSRFGLTPLLSASAWGCAPAIEALLQHRNLAEHVPHDTREQPLAMAARGGFYRSVETLLQYRADPNQPDSSGETALQYAVRAGEIDICRLLLQHGADPNFTADEKHSTPLITAVDKQFKDLVQLLVENGAAIETRETRSTLWERTPLLVATCREDPGIVEFLISKGANLEAVDKDGWSAIFASALYGRTESVRILARAGVDVNSYSAETTETPLHVAIKFPETVRVLLQHGANVNLPSLENDEFRTPFDRAVRGNHVETVKIMLEEAQNAPDLTLPSTKKALQNAVTWDYQEVVALVLEAGADVNLVDGNGWSLVALAVQHKSPAMMRSILEYRPKINTRGPDENTPLHLIVTETPLETVRLLVHAGAQLTATNKYSLTPIINVLTIGHEEAARYLLTKSPVFALLKAPPVKDALAPLQAACYSGNLNLVQLLVEKGCDVNSHCGGILATPLMAVASRNTDVQDTERIKVMEYLLDRGADPTIPAGQVAYPISSACWTCSPDIVQILLDRKVSTNVSDSFGRRPIHFACYNSLAVLDLLGVQDEDFTVEDSTGRLPLHYAVLSGQMALVKEVLLRSERVGIDINVVDKNNWTPLMWAARASRLFDRTQDEVAQDEDVISFLLEKGADKNMLGNGFNRTWSALQVAQYHQDEKIAKLLGEGLATHEASGPILRGTYGEGRLCDCCFVEIWGLYSECVTCSNYHLCYKCYLAKSIFHSQHEFNDGGSESYSIHEVTEKAVSVKSGSAKGGLSDEGETTNQFDDEIVDEENLVHTEDTV